MRFQVYCPSFRLGRKELKVVFDTFDLFWHSLTPKHRERIEFVFWEQDTRRSNLLDSLCEWRQSAIVHQGPNPPEAPQNNGVWFVPTSSVKNKDWVNNLANSLPLVSFSGLAGSLELPEHSGVFISEEEVSPDGKFANCLNMLYHDPWALRHLMGNLRVKEVAKSAAKGRKTEKQWARA
ncbi:MAG: hypothetical protein AAGH79_03815 [Bacteroidota bacterium]